MRITAALAQGQPRDAGSNKRQGGSLVKAQATESAEATGSQGAQLDYIRNTLRMDRAFPVIDITAVVYYCRPNLLRSRT